MTSSEKDGASAGSIKRFSGEDEDPGKQLKKWKTWARAKMMTLKEINDKQKAPWLLTLLDGKAWDACEHLSLEQLAVVGGEDLIWECLQDRFPEKEQHDLMGESLSEVFSLAASDQETMKKWTSRVKETFEKCTRRSAVDFPSQARGWIALHCCGLTEEQKAIVKAKSQGNLEFDTISAALRSCFPTYKAVGKKRSSLSVFQVEPDDLESRTSMGVQEFDDVEAFLADHDQPSGMVDALDEQYSEGEAAEALAVSWRERRKEIAKFQQSRQFSSAGKSKRSFRVEVEELKKRTRCRKCGKLGHWARERTAPGTVKKDGNDGGASSSHAATVNYVEVENEEVWDEEPAFVGMATEVLSSGLVQSVGYGVVDSGCGRTLIGRQTLNKLKDLLQQHGRQQVREFSANNTFRFGNGSLEKSVTACHIPVGIAGKFGVIDAAVISGSAPLLIGRPTLEKMKARLDFCDGTLHFLDTKTKMITNSAGQVLIDVMNYPADKQSSTIDQALSGSQVTPQDQRQQPIMSHTGFSNTASRKTKITLKNKECRCLLAQYNKHEKFKQSQWMVAELFSPPRFVKYANELGKSGKAYDVKTSYNLEDPEVQRQVDRELDQNRPALLVACPPCTYRGGWEHINRTRRSPLETARLLRQSRKQVAFCKEQIDKQVKRGGAFMFEHPLPSEVWKEQPLSSLKKQYGLRRIDMCAYDLTCPDSDLPIQKATGILSSSSMEHEGCRECFRTCPGCAEHRPIHGKLRNGMNVSTFCAEYTQRFVQDMTKACIPSWVDNGSHEALASGLTGEFECLAGEQQPDQPEPDQPDASAEVGAEDRSNSVSSAVASAIKRLHNNLGHPHTKDLIRILRHSNASSEAIRAAQNHQCDVCLNHKQPASSLPAKTSRVMEFNEKIGLDVKYLPGWRENQQVPCVSIVDYATSMHIMAPIFNRETAEVLKRVLRDSWVSWAGPPSLLEMDPAKPNLSELLGEYCEAAGIDVVHTAADSHWQLGKVERHGQWFQRIFERVCEEHNPMTAEEFVDCVLQTQTAKNSLISESGASPCQLVFGRNPRVPQDLLQENPHVPASDAVLADSGYQRSQAIRQSARLAVLQCQDDKALRHALHARPRVQRQFASGGWVYYWRSQKWQNGVLLKGGRWHGAALVLGRLGINWIVAHRRSVFRCSPEQLRHATASEREVANFDQNELLGIKTLLERGQFPKGQFVDLVNQGQPESPEQVQVQQLSRAKSAAEQLTDTPASEQVRTSDSAPQDVPSRLDEQPLPSDVPPSSDPWSKVDSMPRTEAYGPFRRVRHLTKSPPEYLHRPPAMEQEDFAEMIREMVPSMIDEQLADQPMTSPRGESTKREASQEDSRPAVRARTSEPDAEDALCVEHDPHDPRRPVDILVAAFLQKKAQKEIKPSGHDPELQSKIDASKTAEWETLIGKNAVRVWSGSKARQIRREQGHRFIGSRMVVVNKKDEEGERIKSRWCLQGHMDPDFKEKISSGLCHSPTLHPLSRSLILQILVSKGWLLQLGDIKGAFLEAGAINPKFSPLYTNVPDGGIPGLDPQDVIEVLGNVYGSNDAPFNWWHTFDTAVQAEGWVKSQFDHCLYYLYETDPKDQSSKLCGVLGSHVDDTMTGGSGSKYEATIRRLKERFHYRKWRQGSGDFCGVSYVQDPVSMEISYDQRDYAQHLRPIHISKDRAKNKENPVTDKELASLRAINGAANWLSSQSRPDLCVQTSFSQQCFPNPKVKDVLYANQVVHRAKQYSSVEVTVKWIPWEELSLCFHSDAGFGNAKANSAQAGYIAAFTSHALGKNEPSLWSPFAWKSYKLPRKVASTLAGESQAFATASAVCEWMALMVAEARDGSFDMRTSTQWQDTSVPAVLVKGMKLRDQIKQVKIIGITDCKSLYDNLHSLSSISKVDDKRVAIDLAIVKQSMNRFGLGIRWCPTQLMLADGLTKDQLEPADLLRSALQLGVYQLHEEAAVLEQKKQLRIDRDNRRINQIKIEAEQQKAKQEKKFRN